MLAGAVRALQLDLPARRHSGLPGPQGNGYQVRYVSRVTEDGCGRPQPLAGGTFLSIVVHGPTHDADYHPTYAPSDPAQVVNVTGFRTFRQAAFFGTFEGQTTLGLGVRARLPFRAFILPGPGNGSRVVIDVAHRGGR
jgi:hypothetical protein